MQSSTVIVSCVQKLPVPLGVEAGLVGTPEANKGQLAIGHLHFHSLSKEDAQERRIGTARHSLWQRLVEGALAHMPAGGGLRSSSSSRLAAVLKALGESIQ